MDPDNRKVVLEYGRPPAKRWQRRLARGVIWVIVLGAIGLAARWAVHLGGPHWVAYVGQRDVEAVVAARGAVIYSEEPAEIARLTGQTQYELRRTEGNSGAPTVERMAASHQDPNQPDVGYRSGMAPIGLRRVPGGPWRVIGLDGGQYGTLPDGSRTLCSRLTKC